ncbi:MAG: TIGR03915 family putative DNA repair protein [Endomicrobia bacterium]|nr:TIGR03915 family putative DNA repair protein [Endomicrobiia bacterium]MCL2145268.1 TIGR03915 family putative DNA repair protein [Endomicrobiia bacterium]
MANFINRNIIYYYDGTFDGFLCCVFESFTRKEKPADIVSEKNIQPGLLERYRIMTDAEKAGRVRKSIPKEMGSEALPFLESALMTCLEHKEMHMLDFMRLGYKTGPKVMNMLANDTVLTLTKAVKQMTHEAHKFTGFVRFSVYEGLLVSKIKPKNFVLHILARHFAERMPDEKFVIYDETNKFICAYAKGRYVISESDEVNIPKADAEEQAYRDLWKMFYDTIAVKGRENPKCRMTLMPKRYWSNMTEFQ